MSHPEQATDPFDPFSQWRAVRDSSMKSWSEMMLEFVNSDAYASSSARWLDAYLTVSKSFQSVMDQTMTQTLTHYKIPSTDDITRLADRMWNVELKLDDLDARMDEVVALLKELAARPIPPASAEAPPNSGPVPQSAPSSEEPQTIPKVAPTAGTIVSPPEPMPKVPIKPAEPAAKPTENKNGAKTTPAEKPPAKLTAPKNTAVPQKPVDQAVPVESGSKEKK